MLALPSTPDTKVLLACMPWASVSQPSLALGLIKAELAQVGIGADVAYFNLLFADLVGLDTYEATKNRNVMASEWVFAEGLTDAPTRDGYLGYLASRGAKPPELSLWRALREASAGYFERCLEAVPWEAYQVVGFTTSMMQTVASLRLSLLLKQRYPHLKIVLGGANCEGVMGEALHRHFPHVDVVVRGEVDRIVHELFRRLCEGAPLDGITGICFRRPDGEQGIAPPSPLVTDLTVHPVPEYGDYFEQLAPLPMRDKLNVLLMFESSRGCWWGERSHCKFCALNGQGMLYRTKPVPQIVNEVRTLRERYGINNFAAADNILDRHSVEALGDAFARDVPGVHVFYDIRAAVSRDQMRAMARGGIDELEAGLENLSTPVLMRMGKGATGIHNVRFLRRCREFGINPLWNYLYGFPGERLDEYTEILPKIDPWLHHLPAPDVAFPVSLQRYAPYHSEPEKNGIEVTGPLEDYHYIYGLDLAQLNELAYYFKFRYLDAYDVDTTGMLVAELVSRWQQQGRSGQARLAASLRGQEVVLSDTRLGHERSYRLDRAASLAYRLCESPRTVKQVGEDLLRLDAPAYLSIRGNVAGIFDRLDAAHLLYREGDKVVAIAVPDVDSFWVSPPPRPALTRKPALRVVT